MVADHARGRSPAHLDQTPATPGRNPAGRTTTVHAGDRNTAEASAIFAARRRRARTAVEARTRRRTAAGLDAALRTVRSRPHRQHAERGCRTRTALVRVEQPPFAWPGPSCQPPASPRRTCCAVSRRTLLPTTTPIGRGCPPQEVFSAAISFFFSSCSCREPEHQRLTWRKEGSKRRRTPHWRSRRCQPIEHRTVPRMLALHHRGWTGPAAARASPHASVSVAPKKPHGYLRARTPNQHARRYLVVPVFRPVQRTQPVPSPGSDEEWPGRYFSSGQSSPGWKPGRPGLASRPSASPGRLGEEGRVTAIGFC